MPRRGYIPTKEEEAYRAAHDEYNEKVQVMSTKLIKMGYHPKRAEELAVTDLENQARVKLERDGVENSNGSVSEA